MSPPYSYNSTKTVAIKSSLQIFLQSLTLEMAILYEFRGCKEIVHCFLEENFNSTKYGKGFYNAVLEYTMEAHLSNY